MWFWIVMVSATRVGVALLLGVTLTGCTGSKPAADLPSNSASTSPGTPSGSASAGELPWPAAPTSALPAERGTKMLAEMQRWVDKELCPE